MIPFLLGGCTLQLFRELRVDFFINAYRRAVVVLRNTNNMPVACLPMLLFEQICCNQGLFLVHHTVQS